MVMLVLKFPGFLAGIKAAKQCVGRAASSIGPDLESVPEAKRRKMGEGCGAKARIDQ